MKRKDFLIDYCVSILLNVLGPIIRLMPKPLSFFIGRSLGDLGYLFDLKHRRLAYANLKIALGDKFSPPQLRGIVRKFYRAFGQNFIEMLYIPRFDKEYLKRYVSIEGYQNVEEGFRRGKGVIFVAMHAGGWELANIICANLGFAFSLFVRGQNFPRIERILNSYRRSQGCSFIQRENQLKELIRVLKANQAVALTIDQGGRNGTPVKFFNKYASMASGAVRLALKQGCALIPVFPTRIKGAKIKFLVEPFNLRSTGDLEQDVRDNLRALVEVFEKHITNYPQEYLWSYKIWKYTTRKNILILSDGKTGHLRQSQSLAKITADHLSAKGITCDINISQVKFKSVFKSRVLLLASCFSGEYVCQGCMFCLRASLLRESYQELMKANPDIIISCGSALVPVNYLLSRETLAKSLVIMRPSILSTRRFDLVVIPEHDRLLPGKNIVSTTGALNLIDRDYLASQTQQLIRETGVIFTPEQSVLGVLLGGNTRDFRMDEAAIKPVLSRLKDFCLKFNSLLLLTTSRRTPKGIISLVKKELLGFAPAKIVIIAGEKNYPSAVGGILGLSRIVVVSGESISMVSEAVSSLKYTVVFKSPGLSSRRRMFLDNLAAGKHIYLVEPDDIGRTIERIMIERPEIKPLRDNERVRESLRRIL